MPDQRAEVCAFCDCPIFGGPGGWHDETGHEVCPSGALPNVFHEPRDIEAQDAARRAGAIEADQPLPTAGEVAHRLSMALAEAGRPDLRGEVRTCLICRRKRAYVGPATSDADEAIAARAFMVAFRRFEPHPVGRRSTERQRTTCSCSRFYREDPDV